MSEFDGAFARERETVDRALTELRRAGIPRMPAPIGEAVDYALSGSGKRIRGVLLLLAHGSVGGTGQLSGLAAAVETVHAYSLIHDDLPSMDDDDMRRGKPTVHRRFGSEAATVAGLAMVPVAVLAGVRAARRAQLPHSVSATIVNELMRAAGGGGMIGGQVLDLDAEGRSLGLDELDRLHTAKTGALFSAAARIGGVAAETTSARVDALGRFGAALGLAFQITDDVLDVTATTTELGKDAGRDAALHKSTYASAVGISAAQSRAHRLISDACAELRSAGVSTERLAQLADVSIRRAA